MSEFGVESEYLHKLLVSLPARAISQESAESRQRFDFELKGESFAESKAILVLKNNHEFLTINPKERQGASAGT